MNKNELETVVYVTGLLEATIGSGRTDSKKTMTNLQLAVTQLKTLFKEPAGEGKVRTS